MRTWNESYQEFLIRLSELRPLNLSLPSDENILREPIVMWKIHEKPLAETLEEMAELERRYEKVKKITDISSMVSHVYSSRREDVLSMPPPPPPPPPSVQQPPTISSSPPVAPRVLPKPAPMKKEMSPLPAPPHEEKPAPETNTRPQPPKKLFIPKKVSEVKEVEKSLPEVQKTQEPPPLSPHTVVKPKVPIRAHPQPPMPSSLPIKSEEIKREQPSDDLKEKEEGKDTQPPRVQEGSVHESTAPSIPKKIKVIPKVFPPSSSVVKHEEKPQTTQTSSNNDENNLVRPPSPQEDNGEFSLNPSFHHDESFLSSHREGEKIASTKEKDQINITPSTPEEKKSRVQKPLDDLNVVSHGKTLEELLGTSKKEDLTDSLEMKIKALMRASKELEEELHRR